jgi:hypothetical protein
MSTSSPQRLGGDDPNRAQCFGLARCLLQHRRRYRHPYLAGLQERLAAGLMAGSRFLAGPAINIGQNAPDLVVSLAVEARIKDAIPLRAEPQHALLEKLTIVIRVTVKGNIVVAALQ